MAAEADDTDGAGRDSAPGRVNRQQLRQLLTGPPSNLAALSAAPCDEPAFRLAVRRVAIATLAIERYRRAHDGAPPPDLAALVPAFLEAVPIDPFSGKPPVYRPSARSYTLYALDVNRIDDGGALYGLAPTSAGARRITTAWPASSRGWAARASASRRRTTPPRTSPPARKTR